LEVLANRLGVGDHVQIVTSPTDEELRVLIGASSAFCSSSAYEGFGMAAIEAASAGLFPVLSDIPPHRAHVEALGFGLIVDFEMETKWHDSIAAFLEATAAFHRDVSLTQVSEAVQPYSWEGTLEKFERAYEKVLRRATCL
jgi:alpha-1,3-mannosyltransferase